MAKTGLDALSEAVLGAVSMPGMTVLLAALHGALHANLATLLEAKSFENLLVAHDVLLEG